RPPGRLPRPSRCRRRSPTDRGAAPGSHPRCRPRAPTGPRRRSRTPRPPLPSCRTRCRPVTPLANPRGAAPSQTCESPSVACALNTRRCLGCGSTLLATGLLLARRGRATRGGRRLVRRCLAVRGSALPTRLGFLRGLLSRLRSLVRRALRATGLTALAVRLARRLLLRLGRPLTRLRRERAALLHRRLLLLFFLTVDAAVHHALLHQRPRVVRQEVDEQADRNERTEGQQADREHVQRQLV